MSQNTILKSTAGIILKTEDIERMKIFADLYDESIKIVALDNDGKKHFIKTSLDALEARFD
jgi:hypothetical protein